MAGLKRAGREIVLLKTLDLPKISLVTPSFNQAAYLEQNIQSVSGQRGVEVEHILLDGGSSDGSAEIIRNHAQSLAYWRSQKDGGQTKALREGFALATGQVCGWLNSDDYLWSPDALRAVAKAFAEHPEVDMVTGDPVLVFEDGTPLMIDMLPRPSARRLRYLMALPQQSTFWRASAYKEVGGIDENFAYCMDYDLFQRLSQGRKILRLPKVLAAFRMHRAAKTQNLYPVFQKELDLLQKRYGQGWLHELAVKLVTLETRIDSLLAEAAALLSGRELPCLANARIEPMRWWVRRKWRLEH